MSDAQFAKFDKNGKYLYFTASTNLGLTTAWLDMSGDERPVSRWFDAALEASTFEEFRAAAQLGR